MLSVARKGGVEVWMSDEGMASAQRRDENLA